MKSGLLTLRCLFFPLSFHISAYALHSAPLFEWRGEGAASTGLGRCSLLIEDPGLAGLNNPARAAEERGLTISLCAAHPYSVPGLFLGTAWFARGGRDFGAGAGFSAYGDGVYREERLTAGCAWKAPPFFLGTQLSWNRVVIEGLGARSFASASVGFLWGGEGALHLAFVLRDAASFGSGLRKETRPTGAVSASVRFADTGTAFFLELRGTSDQFTSLSLGLESRLMGPVSFRMGMGRNPSLFSMGLGVSLAILRVDLGVEEHASLGQTRCASITLFPSRF
jgi:hypothetical protein